ncbi:hypothetical protein [Ligaoa zhengdingensis]|uniref:hypothetical protein n=1 Tax=Ligaoa zhengdingensis TaxID=2763658 RepID=UPI0031BA862E
MDKRKTGHPTACRESGRAGGKVKTAAPVPQPRGKPPVDGAKHVNDSVEGRGARKMGFHKV